MIFLEGEQSAKGVLEYVGFESTRSLFEYERALVSGFTPDSTAVRDVAPILERLPPDVDVGQSDCARTTQQKAAELYALLRDTSEETIKPLLCEILNAVTRSDLKMVRAQAPESLCPSSRQMADGAMADDRLDSSPAQITDGREHEYLDAAHYVLCGIAREMQLNSNDGHSVVTRDLGRKERLRLTDFRDMAEARESQLDLMEVAALRLYTTNVYQLINWPLRNLNGGIRHPLALASYCITNALKKLRVLNFQHARHGASYQSAYLWRGLKDKSITENFRVNGGCEIACMSTSSDLSVVSSYSASKCPLLFRIKIDSPMDRGVRGSDWHRSFAQVTALVSACCVPAFDRGQVSLHATHICSSVCTALREAGGHQVAQLLSWRGGGALPTHDVLAAQ